MAQLFIETLKLIIENNKLNITHIIWNCPYFYETISDEETLAHKVSKLQNHRSFKDFISNTYMNYDIMIDRDIIRILPNEFEQLDILLNDINIVNHANIFCKISLFIKGNLLYRPNRLYSINFINKDEYVIHVYNIDKSGNKNMIHIKIIPYHDTIA
jgi:hypothetical protein